MNGYPVFAQETAPNEEGCSDLSLCPIPYVRLSTQDERPFLFGGKVVDGSHGSFSQYEGAISKFPSVTSCINHNSGRGFNLQNINFGKINSIQEIDVCVFRVTDSIEKTSEILAWLQRIGFETRDFVRFRSENFSPRSELDRIYIASAILELEKLHVIVEEKEFGFFRSLISMIYPKGVFYTLSISLAESGRVVSVSSIVNTK